MGEACGWGPEYPRRDSNPRIWLRRPALYPLSYGGSTGKLYQLDGGATRRHETCARPCKTGVAAPTSSTWVQRSLRYLIRSAAVAPAAATLGRSKTPALAVKLDAEGT